jgi:hypothetical protein
LYKGGLDASAGNSLGIIMSYLSIQFSPGRDDFVTEGRPGTILLSRKWSHFARMQWPCRKNTCVYALWPSILPCE